MNCRNAFFPFRIININIKNAPFFNEHYWNYFDIDKHNKKLSTIRNNVCPDIDLNLPPMRLQFESTYFSFKLGNTHTVEAPWNIKKIQMCDCHHVLKPIGINRFSKVFDCEHRTLIQTDQTEGIADPHGTVSIDFQVNYTLQGATDLKFLFSSNKFSVQIIFHLNIVLFEPQIMIMSKGLLPVAFRDLYQPVQGIWMYNPFTCNLIVKVEQNIENEDIFEILTKELEFEFGEYKPILIRFTPDECRAFQCELLLKVHEKIEGTDNNLENLSNEASLNTIDNNMPLDQNSKLSAANEEKNPSIIKEECNIVELPLKFEVKCQLNESVPLKNSPYSTIPCKTTPVVVYKNNYDIKLKGKTSIDQMIVLHNYSEECIKYVWDTSYLEDYYTITVLPNCGILCSNVSKCFILKTKSENFCCNFNDIPLKCHIYKYDQVIRKSLFPDGYFEYTDQGYYEKPDSPPPERAEFMYTILISINLRVYHAKNIDSLVSITNQLQLKSTENVLSSSTMQNEKYSGLIDRIFMEKMIWMTIHSEEFKNQLFSNANQKNPMYENAKKTIQKKPTGEPDLKPKPYIGDIITNLLAELVNETSKEHRFIPPN